MPRFPLRFPLAVLALAALAACDRSATAPAKQFEGTARRAEAPVLTVTNSGGYPLIGWTALAGATSYSVVLHQNRLTIQKSTFQTETQNFYYSLGSTSGTTFLDTAHAYTGSSSCSAYGTYTTVISRYTYRVTASFADGSSSIATISAPVAPC